MATDSFDPDALIGLEVAEAKDRVARVGMRVKVVDGSVTSLERGINRVTLFVKDGIVVRAGGF